MKIIKGSLSDVILLSFEKAVDGYVRMEDFLYNTHIYARGYDRPLKKSSLSKALKRLREKGLVEAQVGVEHLAFKLTNAGHNLMKQSNFTDQDWDGIWRVVIFDIPEDQRRIRRILRSRLKIWGFIPWQKSVWATKRSILNELKEIISDLKIERWVIILESKDVKLNLK